MSYKFGRSILPHQRKAVAWYAPEVLLTAGRELVSSIEQLRNWDRRESYNLPLNIIDLSTKGNGSDFWFDFISDTGDGGNATYAVAKTALADDVEIPDGATLPRGELLLFGGDLCYPGASAQEYQYRFIEPFEGVRATDSSTAKKYTIASIPQNHDWMDSLSTFNRYFIRNKSPGALFGADVPQQQSYFCVKLPHGWWVLGIDFALMHDIDRDQFEQFAAIFNGDKYDKHGDKITCKADVNDKVILIYPEPYWTRPIGDDAPSGYAKRYQRLEHIIGKERIAIRLAGDLHQYRRWTSDDHGQLIICGTGGAFTHPTHTKVVTESIAIDSDADKQSIPKELGERLRVGRVDKKMHGVKKFDAIDKATFPDECVSFFHAFENVIALFKSNNGFFSGNRMFAVSLGLLYWFNAYLNSLPFSASFIPDNFYPMQSYSWCQFFDVAILWLKAMIFSPFGFLVNIVMIAGCVLMGREMVDELPVRYGMVRRWLITATCGTVHGLIHGFAIFTLEFSLQHWVNNIPDIPIISSPSWIAIFHAIFVGTMMICLGAFLGALIFGSFLAAMSVLGYLTNNGYSALGIEDYKGFMRFKLTKDGALTAYFIAINKPPKEWVQAAKNPATPHQALWEPAGGKPISLHLQDEFTIACAAPTKAAPASF